MTQLIEGNSSSVYSLLNILLMVLELSHCPGWYSFVGNRQIRLRMTTKVKQATVSLAVTENEVTTPSWDRRLNLEIPL